MTIGLACANGGHLTSMLQLREAFAGKDTFLITYEGARRPNGFSRIYYIPPIAINPISIIISSLRIFAVLIRERPSIVVSTGAEIAVPTLLLAKLIGARTVFVESISRSKNLSVSGFLLHGRVDYFLVQWASLLNRYGSKIEYRGRLL